MTIKINELYIFLSLETKTQFYKNKSDAIHKLASVTYIFVSQLDGLELEEGDGGKGVVGVKVDLTFFSKIKNKKNDFRFQTS